VRSRGDGILSLDSFSTKNTQQKKKNMRCLTIARIEPRSTTCVAELLDGIVDVRSRGDASALSDFELSVVTASSCKSRKRTHPQTKTQQRIINEEFANSAAARENNAPGDDDDSNDRSVGVAAAEDFALIDGLTRSSNAI
jgi:hypothetical protein